jgi:2-keto-3-deoxy-L-rhamnonate aldolase RhmA
MVRVNPLDDESEDEINKVIDAGADYIMLPMFKTKAEVEKFVSLVNGRAKTMLLLETKEAKECLEEYVSVPGIDEIHIGLNDLHLSYGLDFMFELLSDGTVEKIARKIKAKNIPYGFGGIARIGKGMLPAEHVIAEHYRLGSEMAILSRSFCNASSCSNVREIEGIFRDGIKEIYEYQDELKDKPYEFFADNKKKAAEEIERIVGQIKSKR